MMHHCPDCGRDVPDIAWDIARCRDCEWQACQRVRAEVKANKPRRRAVHMTLEEVEEAICDGICEATDGCIVEPDGYCEHGCPSKLLALGLI